MKLIKTSDFEIIRAFDNNIFDDDLSIEEIKKYVKRKKYSSEPDYFLCQNDDKNIGFAVCFTKPDENYFTIWLIGINADQRGKGYGNSFYREIERYYKDIGITNIEVVTYNRRKQMLNLLIKNDFKIVKTEYSDKRNDTKIIFFKHLNTKKEVRISLTEKCNFKCFFCHSDGLDRNQKRKEVDSKKISELLEVLVKNKYTDITFTGGEPLLEKENLVRIIDNLNKLDVKPDLTIVTNGTYIDIDLLEKLKEYNGYLKLNFSFHYYNADDFNKVTGVKRSFFEKIKKNLELAAGSGLTVKVNCVMLRGINNSQEQIITFIDYLSKIGVRTLKLLELLITGENHELYKSYYETDALKEIIKPIAVLYESELRRDVYKYKKNLNFSIELQKLTCKFGCSKCEFIRDRTIDTDMKYFPCFVQGNKPIQIKDLSLLSEYFLQGDRIINANAVKFGSGSPILTLESNYVESETEVFFYFHEQNYNAVIEKLKEKKYIMKEKKSFRLEFYRPQNSSKKWKNYNKVLETGWDHHNDNKIYLIYIDNEFHVEKGLFFTKKRFLNENGPIVLSKEEYNSQLKLLIDKLDIKNFLTHDFYIDLYKKDYMTLSLCKIGDFYSVKIANYELFEKEYLELISETKMIPMLKPLLQFIIDNHH